MWSVIIRPSGEAGAGLVCLFDDERVVRSTGPSFLEALRRLAREGQQEVALDVESAILFLPLAEEQ